MFKFAKSILNMITKTNTISIVPNPHLTKNTTLTGKYNLKDGTVLCLTIGGDVVHEKNLDGRKIFRKDFNNDNREHTFKLVWTDSEPKDVTVSKNAIKKFWQNHPFVKNYGFENPNLQQELFLMEIKEDLIDTHVETLKLKGAVYSIVSNMPVNKQRDLCFYFAGNPTSMSNKELFIDLLDFNSGRLMKDANAIKLIKLHQQGDSEEVKLRTLVKKGLSYRVIEDRLGKFYTKGGELIGVSEEDCVAYYMSNKEMKGFLEKEVAISDVYEYEVVEKIEITNDPIKISVDEEVKEREKAKKLGIAGWATMGFEKLKTKIEEFSK